MSNDRVLEPDLKQDSSVTTPLPGPKGLEQIRESLRALTKALPQPEDVSRQDFNVDDIRLRLYKPNVSVAGPLLVFLHGGGWIQGDLDTHDAVCAWLAFSAGYPVLAVEYRLAPEHPFPAGLDDCDKAFSWAVANARTLGCDPARIAIGGESAGGNLAAAVTLRRASRSESQPLFQLLIHPATDLRGVAPSWREVQVAEITLDALSVLRHLYLTKPEEIENPYVSPYLASSHAALAPAIILTAECDPLRDDGEFYALALAKAGVETTVQRLLGLSHGFMIRPITEPAIAASYNLTGQLLQRYARLNGY